MGEVTLTDIKYLSPVGVAGPLELAFWADFVDPDYLQEFGPLALGVSIFCFIWYFIMPSVHRVLERRVQNTPDPEQQIPLCVVEFGLVWPLIGAIGMVIALGFAVTANSRICMLCATHPDNVRGFGGGFCAYTDDLKESLAHDNSTNCIFVKESIFGPGRRTWMKIEDADQFMVSSRAQVRKFTGTKGIHTLSIKATNESDSEVVTLLQLEQNSTKPVSPFNETMDGLRVFATNQSEPLDFAGTLGWGHGKVYMRASRETVQLIVFRADEMFCALVGALGLSVLISVPWMECCNFDVWGRVNRERYFAVPMSWMMPTNTGLAELTKIKFAYMAEHWLCLSIRAGRTQSVRIPLREMTQSDGAEEVLRIQRFLYQIGVDVELTKEEKDSCEDITPPDFKDEVEEEAPVADNLKRRGKGQRR